MANIKTKSSRVKQAKSTKPKSTVGTDIKSVPLDQVTAIDRPLDELADDFLYIYGSYVNEDRAISDLRDGLKPVHRAALWSAHKLGLRHNSKFRKSAKVVGDVIGSYHPHGDTSAYGAIVGLANAKPNLVRGEGNWGSPVAGAAAMRYTEMRLSLFSDLFLLDPDYLKVVKYVPNFDGTTTMPLHLPALLPVALLIGSVTAPAYGISAGNPPFALGGVVKILANMIAKAEDGKPKKPSAKSLSKVLEVEYSYGNECVSDLDTFTEFLSKGKGSLKFRPIVDAVWEGTTKDQSKKILIRSFSPNFRKESVGKKLETIAALKGVSKAYPRLGKRDKRAGPFGALYVIEPNRGISEDDFYDLAENIQKVLTGSESFDLGCTIKDQQGNTKFKRLSIGRYLQQWVHYRIKLELKMLEHLIGETLAKIEHQELLLFAVDNREKLLKLLPKVLKAKEPDKALAKELKKPIEFASKILDLQIRRLAALERSGITSKIKDLKTLLKGFKADLKNPQPRIVSDLKARVAKYTKDTAKYDQRK